MAKVESASQVSRKERIHQVIFEADTPSGKFFDIALLLAILASILTVSLESVDSIDQAYHTELRLFEWAITILFTLEYLLRLYSTKKSQKYATSFFGIIDLIAIIPTYLSLIIPGAQSLLIVRALRLLRMFRVLKLSRYIGEGEVLFEALLQSRTRIIIFLFTVTILGFISGAMMYLLEGPTNGFTSIPQSVYWSLTTITGTGYGDTVPSTPMGKLLAVVIMVLGYSLIIVPTGIVSSELMKLGEVDTRACSSCSRDGHDRNAKHCKFCGDVLRVT